MERWRAELAISKAVMDVQLSLGRTIEFPYVDRAKSFEDGSSHQIETAPLMGPALQDMSPLIRRFAGLLISIALYGRGLLGAKVYRNKECLSLGLTRISKLNRIPSPFEKNLSNECRHLGQYMPHAYEASKFGEDLPK